ncbi:MAG: 6-bladed beta-propeller, partial [Gemmatimonadales bacterium]
MDPRRRLSAALFSVAVLGGGACSSERGPDVGTWVAEFDTIGDTVVVRTISGSFWGEPMEMVEDLSIGVLDGPEELMFGSIQRIAVDDEGGIYAFDSHVPVLRYFDAGGNYVLTLGREGGGPGEYGDFTGGIVVRHDGRVVLADFRNARLTLYDPDGGLAEHWPLQGGFFPRHPLVVDTADHTYVPILDETMPANQPMKVGYLHLDAEGDTVETMEIPTLPG